MSLKIILMLLLSLPLLNCSKSSNTSSGSNNNHPPVDITQQQVATKDTVNYWVTKADQSLLLTKQTPLVFYTTSNTSSSINVENKTAYQTIEKAHLQSVAAILLTMWGIIL